MGRAVRQSDRREDFKRLAEDTRSFLKQGLPEKTAATKAQLLEIMMAQDFQDLTGQVTKKITACRPGTGDGADGVLIETMPGELANRLGDKSAQRAGDQRRRA